MVRNAEMEASVNKQAARNCISGDWFSTILVDSTCCSLCDSGKCLQISGKSFHDAACSGDPTEEIWTSGLVWMYRQ